MLQIYHAYVYVEHVYFSYSGKFIYSGISILCSNTILFVSAVSGNKKIEEKEIQRQKNAQWLALFFSDEIFKFCDNLS